MSQLVDRLYEFNSLEQPDESTVRKKLKEYTELGIVCNEKCGRETQYKRSYDLIDIESWYAAVAFFSETVPLGIIGSYVQDRLNVIFPFFRYKHHYILNALDSEVIAVLLSAIREKKCITIYWPEKKTDVLPLKIYISTQTGKQLLFGFSYERNNICFFRIDRIESVHIGKKTQISPEITQKTNDISTHTWGVSVNHTSHLEHIEMIVEVNPGEEFIIKRLKREKRCGTVCPVDDTHWKFSADIYDPYEMIPWLRTFIGRITDLQCSDLGLVEIFRKDFTKMCDIYGNCEN